jgi:two-component system chemotaxis response regulator CheY
LFNNKLQKAGHEVVGKGIDGDEGIKLYLEKHPDLVLLDITMPNKDGRECLAEILKADPLAKIIMVSAIKDDAVVNECLKIGAKGFISKTNIHGEEEFQREVLNQIDKVLKAA